MVRKSEQIIGAARTFLLLPAAEKVVILQVNTDWNHQSKGGQSCNLDTSATVHQEH